MTRPFRFGFTVLGVGSRREFIEQCRSAERYGYDVTLAADHLGMPSAFPTLMAAADATERLRIGTLVLNAGLWNPHLLARDIATVDRLTDGRLEVGLGAGYSRWEFEAAGIVWRGFQERVRRLESTINQVRELLAGPGYEQDRQLREMYGLPELTPSQRDGFGGYGPPLFVGGTADAVLRVAARHADIVGIAGTYHVKDMPSGVVRLGTVKEVEQRIQFVRDVAGDRAEQIEFNAVVHLVLVTGDRRAAAGRLVADRLQTMTEDEVLDSPFLLIGTEAQIAEQLREHRERLGLSYIAVQGPFMAAFGPVIERLRA